MPASPFWTRFMYRSWYAVAVILGGGLAMTYLTYAALNWSRETRLREEMAHEATADFALVQDRLEQLMDQTDPLQRQLGSDRLISAEHFAVEATELMNRRPAFAAMRWVAFGRPGERLVFERASGGTTDNALELPAAPSRGLAASWHVFRIEPATARAAPWKNEPVRQAVLAALETAREKDRPVFTPPHFDESSAKTVVLELVQPVHARDAVAAQSLEAGTFTGCLVSTIRIRDVIASCRASLADEATGLAITDLTPGSDPGRPAIFDSPLASGSAAGLASTWTEERNLPIGQRTWIVRHRADPAWLDSHRSRVPESAALAGALLTLVAAVSGGYSLRRNTGRERQLQTLAAEVEIMRDQSQREIQDRAELEAQLRSSQHQLHALMENSPSAIFMKDAQGRYLTVNRRFAEMHGRSREHFVGRSDLDVFPPEVAARLRLSDTRVLSSGKTIELEDSMGLPNGTQTSIIHKFPLVDEVGNVQGLCGIATDISERKRAEAEIRESRRQLESLLGQLPGMAFRFVNDGNFTPVYVSRGALGLTGHTARDFIEGVVKLENVIHPEDRERARNAIAMAVKKRRSFEVEYRLIDRSGRVKWVLERGQGVYDEDGKLLFIEGLAIDITQRKDAESEKLLVERRLLEGQKLESIGVLAGGIAHDFNNLLTGIIGNANLAAIELPSSSRLQQNLKQIEIASQRAAELCQQMLAYAGKGRFVVQRVDLGSLVENTVPLLRASISKRAQLKFQLTPGLPPVVADPTQMRQIVMNLVLNASEALGDHDGEITIATDYVKPTAEYFAGAVLSPPDLNHEFLMFQVRDTGCGMAPETLAKIFDPFFTTKFAGRGLGLAAVLGIIRSHKGGLKVVSALGRGSTFTLLFPVVHGPAEPGPIRRSTAVPWRQEGLALVIDDEDHVRDVTSGMLHTCGLRTELARDGYEGLDLFRAKPQSFDIILLDMTMPRLSGEETLQLLREVRPDVRVLFMSGYNRREVVDTLAGTGVLSFIQKPFNLDSLRDQLQEMLG